MSDRNIRIASVQPTERGKTEKKKRRIPKKILDGLRQNLERLRDKRDQILKNEKNIDDFHDQFLEFESLAKYFDRSRGIYTSDVTGAIQVPRKRYLITSSDTQKLFGNKPNDQQSSTKLNMFSHESLVSEFSILKITQKHYKTIGESVLLKDVN